MKHFPVYKERQISDDVVYFQEERNGPLKCSLRTALPCPAIDGHADHDPDLCTALIAARIIADIFDRTLGDWRDDDALAFAKILGRIPDAPWYIERADVRHWLELRRVGTA